MNPFQMNRRLTLFVAALFAALGVAAIQAQDPAPPPSSLSIVPQDTSFYLATMNHAKCWHAIVDSNAYKALLASPVGEKMRKAYRRGRAEGFEQFGAFNPFAQYLKGYADVFGNPGTKFAWPFLREMFSNEIFIYGDSKLPELMDAVSQVQLDMLNLNGLDEDELPEAILKSIQTRLGDATFPTIVLGTVLSDPSNLSDLMRLAHSGVENGLQSLPPEGQKLADNYRLLEESDMVFLSMTLDVESVPWEQFELEENIAPIIDGIREVFRDKKLTIGVGVKDHYLIATIGPSLDHIRSLGQGGRLIDSPRLAPLKKALAEGKSLTSANYFSAAYMRRSTDFSGLAQILPTMVESALAQSGNEAATREIVESVRKDSAELVADLAQIIPAPGETFGFGFMTENGIEGFQYDFSQSRFQDSSKPLALFQHAGERPALIVASRGTGSPEQFRFLQKWGGVGLEYFEKILPLVSGPAANVEQILDEPEVTQGTVRKVFWSGVDADSVLQDLAELKPFLKRLGDITSEKLIPATEGGESGLVVDFVESRYQWHPEQPTSIRPLAIPSLAVILQINDAEKIRSAGREYFALAQDVLTWLRKQPDVEIPPGFELLPPEATQVGEAEIYGYPLPGELFLDESILPHARLENDWLVFSYFPDRSGAIASDHQPKWTVPIDVQQPAAGGVYLNAHEFVDAANDWLRFGVEVAEADGQPFELRSNATNDQLDFNKAELMESWDRVVDFVKCFHGLSVLSYTEGDATISHYRFQFRDLE